MRGSLSTRSRRSIKSYRTAVSVAEVLEDRTLLSTDPFLASFDFGTATSPVEDGYTQVDPADVYSTDTGYGWTSGSPWAVSRSTGTALTRDLVYASSLEFAVDAPNGFYDVTLTFGDTARWPHDEMALYLEGVQVDTLSSAPHEVLTMTFQVEVTDGQLNLRLEDLGGSDPNVVLNGLEVSTDSGPRVIAAEPNGVLLDPVGRITLTFNEPVADGSFTLDDIVSFVGPAGSITPTDLVRLDATHYELVFSQQTELGPYTLSLGPDIFDLRGNAMDQDRDGISGEAEDDVFSTSFSIVPLLEKFDFGTTFSPVADGNTQVHEASTYSAEAGFGWLEGAELTVDRASGDDVIRDLAYDTSLTFGLDVPEGVYKVTLTLGDTSVYPHDEMGVFLEGVHVATISTAAYETITVSFEVSVTDGQLTLWLNDLGGSDPNVVISGLEVAWVAPDTIGPMVIDATWQGAEEGSVDRVLLTFSEDIRDGSFTLADVTLTGPDGAITPAEVNRLDATHYEVVFAAQTTAGQYSLLVGPDISDVYLYLMDQDQDGVNGESTDDQFQTDFEIAPTQSEDPAETPTDEQHWMPGEGPRDESGPPWFRAGRDKHPSDIAILRRGFEPPPGHVRAQQALLTALDAQRLGSGPSGNGLEHRSATANARLAERFADWTGVDLPGSLVSLSDTSWEAPDESTPEGDTQVADQPSTGGEAPADVFFESFDFLDELIDAASTRAGKKLPAGKR